MIWIMVLILPIFYVFLFFTGERIVIFVVVVVIVNVCDIDKPGFLLLDAALDL